MCVLCRDVEGDIQTNLEMINTYLNPIQGSRVKLCTDFLIGCPVEANSFQCMQ